METTRDLEVVRERIVELRDELRRACTPAQITYLLFQHFSCTISKRPSARYGSFARHPIATRNQLGLTVSFLLQLDLKR